MISSSSFVSAVHPLSFLLSRKCKKCCPGVLPRLGLRITYTPESLRTEVGVKDECAAECVSCTSLEIFYMDPPPVAQHFQPVSPNQLFPELSFSPKPFESVYLPSQILENFAANMWVQSSTNKSYLDKWTCRINKPDCSVPAAARENQKTLSVMEFSRIYQT